MKLELIRFITEPNQVVNFVVVLSWFSTSIHWWWDFCSSILFVVFVHKQAINLGCFSCSWLFYGYYKLNQLKCLSHSVLVPVVPTHICMELLITFRLNRAENFIHYYDLSYPFRITQYIFNQIRTINLFKFSFVWNFWRFNEITSK